MVPCQALSHATILTLERPPKDPCFLQVPHLSSRKERPFLIGPFPALTCDDINKNTYHHVSPVVGTHRMMLESE